MNASGSNDRSKDDGTPSPSPTPASQPVLIGSSDPPVPPQVVVLQGSRPDGQQIISSSEISVAVRSGPLPSPQDLAEYAKVDPSYPREILAMAKAAMAHAHRMQERDLARRIEGQRCRQIERWAGQACAFILSAGIIGSAVFLAVNGHPNVAAIMVGTTVVALATVFVLGRLYKPKAEQTSEKDPPGEPE